MKSIIAMGVFAVLAADPATASCVQGNMAGAWDIYMTTQAANGALGWIACTLNINSVGNFTANNSSCADSTALSTNVAGSVKLLQPVNCRFRGTINNASFAHPIYLLGITMAGSKESASGVGGGTSYGSPFTFNMVKIQ